MTEQLSLLELNLKIKHNLQEQFSDSYWVVAEISELRVNSRGHCYLELVEKKDDEILAKMRATIWSYTYRNLSGWFQSITGEPLRPGMNILASVMVNFHEVFGISLNIRDIDAKYTLGERAKRRQEILDKLQKDGIADMNKELSLPVVPQRLAIIASGTSAGYQDFIQQLTNNQYGYKFSATLFSSVMQGRDAEKSIIGSLIEANTEIEKFDILIIIRGGGATLDLDCFDGYNLASHVAQFPIPVVTGIGHERDETITDLVANTRLKTPTAVAEFIISGCRIFEERINEIAERIDHYSEDMLSLNKNQLEKITRDLRHISSMVHATKKNNLSHLEQRFRLSTENKIDRVKSFLSLAEKSIRQSSKHILANNSNILSAINSKIVLSDPEEILKRGFSITRYNNKPVRDPSILKKNDLIETELAEGIVKSKIFK